MILCIDSGNTRIKWGLHDGRGWCESGAVAHAHLPELAALTQRFSPEKVVFSNVAGDAAAQGIYQALAIWQPLFIEARASQHAAGVSNQYENPQQLGVDRWCALIGARGLTQKACLVVMAGTATTIDTLDDAGNFLGGLILPGLDLMRRSLARDTAALPLARGQHTFQPRNTDDAIVSGCLEAQAGAIERAFARMPPIAGQADARCLLSGGAAQAISPCLGLPHQIIDNLVLEGLIRLATCDD